MGNEIIDQIFTEKELPQAYGPAILKNLASAVTKFWQTEARNGQEIKKLKTECFCYFKLLKVLCPYTE